jgi:hypothetical protein
MADYKVKKAQGLVLRLAKTGVNLFSGWEMSEFVMIDFGKRNARKNFRPQDPDQLRADEIKDLEKFFEQYGEWCAFNYVIGAQDRHPANFIYDLQEQRVYSVDNEERPYQPDGSFVPFDSQVSLFSQAVQPYLPSDKEERQGVVAAFKKAFVSCWARIRIALLSSVMSGDPELSSEDARPDLRYAELAVDRDSHLVLAKITL